MIADFAKMPHNASPAPATGNRINIKIRGQSDEVFFRVKRDLPFGKVFDTWCGRLGRVPSDFAFLYDGGRLKLTDTPDSVSLHHLLGLLVTMSDNDLRDQHEANTFTGRHG